MAYWRIVLAAKIEAQLRGDVASGGLFNVSAPLVRGLYNNWFNANQVMPFLVYDILPANRNDAFDVEVWEVTVRVHLYLDSRNAPELTNTSAIEERIVGDWREQPDRVPTYGLDRFQPVLSATDYTTSMMALTTSGEAHEEDYYHFYWDFATLISAPSLD